MSNYHLFQKILFSNVTKCCGLMLLVICTMSGTCKPVATVDLPATDLDVKISVIDVTETPSDGKVPVVMQFFSNGSYVKLPASVTVTCNGVTLTDHGIGYAERVPLVTAGNQYVFRHQRGPVSTVVNVTVPVRPTINTPAQNATITRTTSLAITYVSGTGTGIRGGAGDPSTGLSGTVQSDNGNYTGLDVSSLKVGPGTISITRELQNNPSTGFKSTEVKFSISKDRAVTWN